MATATDTHRLATVAVAVTIHTKLEEQLGVQELFTTAATERDADALQRFVFKVEPEPVAELRGVDIVDKDAVPDGAYVIFDVFSSREAARTHEAHAAETLGARGPVLLRAAAPAVECLDILASKVAAEAAGGGALRVGSLVHITVRYDVTEQVRVFLSGPYADAIRREEITRCWYAFQRDATAFGLCALWRSAEERAAHYAGPAVAGVVGALRAVVAAPVAVWNTEVVAAQRARAAAVGEGGS